jgi:acyl-coenzyme A synthetase/AMP-(fatty) acid ligase
MAFYDSFERFGDRMAVIDDRGQSITYRELADWSKLLGQKMQRRTLAFCFCENSLGSPIGYLACMNNRVVPLLLDRKIDEQLLEHLLEVYQPLYLYFPADMKERFAHCEVLHEEYQYVLARNPLGAETPLYEELGLLLTTSGSTGSPKLVRHSYRNLQSNAEAIAEYLELDENERPISTLPMNYTYGLSIISSHAQVGATMLMTECSILMKAFWTFLREQRATSFGGVPFTFELLKKVRFFRMDLPDLKYLTQAGGKLSPEMHHEFATWARENNKKFIVMYGQTEASPRMGYLPAEFSLEKFGSMGKAIPGGHFVLTDTEGQPITVPDQVGELVYEGENVTLGYAECREDLAKGDERHGTLVTGDMARMDADGLYSRTEKTFPEDIWQSCQSG